MADEFDKPLDEPQNDEVGEDVEVPLLPLPGNSDERQSNKDAKLASRYPHPPLKGLRIAWRWLSSSWLGQAFRSSSFWTAAATVVIAGATIIYTIYAKRQWEEIHTGSSDTHELAVAATKQAERMQNVSDAADKIRQAAEGMVKEEQRIADNAKRAIDASNAQSQAALDASIAASRLDQRPWILPSAFTLLSEPETGKQFRVDISVSNTGKTPAFELIPQSQVGLLYNCDMLPLMVEVADVKSRGMLPPGQTGMSYNSEPSMQVTEPMLTSYKNGITKIFVQGLIRYTDEFHQRHWTRFRVFHEHDKPATTWSYCDTGNDTDRVDVPKEHKETH